MIKWPISRGCFSNELESQVLDSINAKKTKNQLLWYLTYHKTPNKTFLWTVLWLQIFHKKFCIIKWPISRGSFSIELESQVLDSINAKKTKNQLLWYLTYHKTPNKTFLWTVLWLQIFHKKFCIIKWPISRGSFSIELESQVLDSINAKKTKNQLLWYLTYHKTP